MGAYYTKEDITDYIGKNTIIPYLFDAAREKCPIAFQPGGALWGLLRDDPDRYIYEAVRQGVDLPLPAAIASGVADVSRWEGWNKPADAAYALPTETWREHVARRTRCLDLRARLRAGEVGSINDLITHNLNIRQFAQDAIETCEGPELLRAFYHSIAGRIPRQSNETYQRGISVLDPTCGSGAFLFAALNILEPLYEACLERMESFVTDHDRALAAATAAAAPEATSGAAVHLAGTARFVDFRALLADVGKHHNRRYYILKSIIIGNLYGVDIMDEAVEICKLRLFLKLVAQVERVEHLEPLPDIDFNIRAGNTLIGYTHHDAVREAIKVTATGQQKILFDDDEATMRRIDERAEVADRAYQQFQRMQTNHGMDAKDFAGAKADLRRRLDDLGAELDRYLATQYGVAETDAAAFAAWRHSHQPFHWFVDFYGIMSSGGFDVIVGNPPYVEKRIVQGQYRLDGYVTDSSANLYAYVTERALSLLRQTCWLGLIVPLSSMSTEKFVPLQDLITRQSATWLSNYDDRPARLFDGLEHIQLTVVNCQKKPTSINYGTIMTTRCVKWGAIERPMLFSALPYERLSRHYLKGSVPKIWSSLENSILNKIWSNKTVDIFVVPKGDHIIYYTRKVHSFLNILDFVPKIINQHGKQRAPSEQKILLFRTRLEAQAALCALNSTLFRWFLTTFSDCRNLNKREVLGFPVDLSKIVRTHPQELISLSTQLSSSLKEHSELRRMRFGSEVLDVQCIIPRHSKPIIDQIDRVLAQHYGFTDEELDFIINYDIKYRMGRDDGEDEQSPA